jgi:acetaldehyde dehydrogenase/alcohol dehydrogenase
MPDLPVNHDYIDKVMENASHAAAQFLALDQEQVDAIVRAVYAAGFDNRVRLARMAVKETKLGVLEHKVIKNIIATRFVFKDIRELRTVGVVSEDAVSGITEIAQPIGPIFAVTPVTNPTSTVLFKALIALKTRNPLIIRPHGAAKRCSVEAARVCYDAARAAGAPEHCIQWVPRTTQEETLVMMAHRKTALVLATGSVSLVRAAYSSGNPAIGIGPGNVPVYIGRTAELPFAVEQIFLSKTFDNGTICASEQAVVLPRVHEQEVLRLFRAKGAHVLSESEVAKVGAVAVNLAQRVMNPAVIGQPAPVIARMAGIDVPDATTLLIAPLQDVGPHAPLSLEILAPILAFYLADRFDEAIELCRLINRYGGLGHTASIFSTDERKIEYFSKAMNAGRILVNTPASHGALGGSYNALQPSMTLACGAGGKNITTDNISARHLIHIQRVARRRESPCTACADKYCCDESVTAAMLDGRCRKYNGQPEQSLAPGTHCGEE